MDVSHELRDGLVRRKLHPNLHRHARIRNLSGGAMADAMRSHVWDLCSFEDALPAPRIGVLGHWLLWVGDGRHDVGRTSQTRCIRKKRDDVLAHGFRDCAGLAVWPDDAPMYEVDPLPFHVDDLTHARRKGELQTNSEDKKWVLEPLRFGAL